MTSSGRNVDAIECRLIFAACFVVFLIAAVGGRLLPWRWRGYVHAHALGSVFREARAAASKARTFAYMG